MAFDPDRRDVIEVRGLRVMGTHGVLAEEQHRAQPFELDLDVFLDLTAAGGTDRLEETVDYAALADRAAGVVASERHALLERLATRVAEEVLHDPRVRSVAVTVRKLRPPVPLHLASVGVRIVRP